LPVASAPGGGLGPPTDLDFALLSSVRGSLRGLLLEPDFMSPRVKT
jgi:hypothetical protein